MTTSTPSTPEEKRAAGLARAAAQQKVMGEREEVDKEYLRKVLQGNPVRPLPEKEGRRLLSLVTKENWTNGLQALLEHPDLPEDLLRKVASRSGHIDAVIGELLLKHPNKSIELEILVAQRFQHYYKLLERYREDGNLSIDRRDTDLIARAALLWGPGAHDTFSALMRRVILGDEATREVFEKLLEDWEGTRDLSIPEKRRRLRELVGISEFI